MESRYIKHTMMCVPDLSVRYEINDADRIVLVDLPVHFDSSLLTWFALTLEEDHGIQVVEYQAGYKRPHAAENPKHYRLVVGLAGVRFNAVVAQMMSLQPGRTDEFTVCLLREGAPVWGDP